LVFVKSNVTIKASLNVVLYVRGQARRSCFGGFEMKASVQLLLASLAAGSVLPRDQQSTNQSAIADGDFVYVDGTRLYNKDGLYYLTGT
jgi:hypothetical protein